ncbi:glycine cleavage system protein H [Apostichopus japonicus]|uniref:Glycine cleavage system H protein n=2 Tax=Stichopus japonicus TaxID=307972 RepID=A0A2G8K619_STIJA|nr:glycine cleavage system protein H [Apostichopus japonicus]
MNKLLSEMRFTEEHEWVRQEGSTPHVTVGITDYAQDSLGDIVFVELPEVGSQVVEKDSIGAIESVKAVSDVYCPASGTVTEVNTELESTPEVVNTSPLEDGWLFKMELADVSSLDTLLTEKEYKDYLHGLE